MRLVSRAAHRADLIITDSHASARDIQRLLGIPETRIRVIYLAASEIYRPLPEAEREPVLARYGIGFPYLLYLGGFDCRKNVLDIVRAYAQVSDTLDDVRLVIAGRLPHTDSAFAPDPRRVSDELGLGERVHYAGWIAEEAKPALYSGALAFCFPSRYEGFGLPVLEAIACGTPAIIGSGSSLEEVGGAAALSVPPGDIDRLSEAMQQLVEDARLHERLSKAGLAHASRFSWKKTARKTRRVYEEVVGR
jgi:glycosyltransferase involved in cell wall biosynthesis